MNDTGHFLFLISLLPFLGALIPGLMIRAGRNACAIFTALPTALALILLMILAPAVLRGEVIEAEIAWLPQLGLSVSFFLDGLGLLFAAMILGVGLLITLYARFYLSREDPMGQFYTYLLLFQGAMLGIVISDNILLLLVFWELTSLSSFLLIGYWKHLPEGRQGARMALAVTGGGGAIAASRPSSIPPSTPASTKYGLASAPDMRCSSRRALSSEAGTRTTTERLLRPQAILVGA